MIDPSQNSESATSTNLIDQEERESHYHFIQRSSDWIELIHNKKPLNNMPHRNKYNDTPSDTSSNNTTPSNVNNNDSPDITPLHIYLTTHKHGHHMIHAKKDQPFAPSFLNDAGYESGSSSNDDDTAPSSACDEVTPAITTPVHFLTEQHHPFSPTTINKSSSTKEFPTSHNSDNVQKKRSRVASLPVSNQQEKLVTNNSKANLPTTNTNNDNTTISTTSQTPPTNIENPTAGLHHIQSQPNMLSNQPISLLSQSLLKQTDEHDFYMVNEEEVSSASALIGRQKYYSEVNLPSMDASPLKSNSQLVKKPIIKHNIGKNHPEGTESWLLPGECVLNHVKKVGVVKNLPITYFPPTHSNPQAISTQGPFVEPPKQASGEFLTTAEELLHDFNVYDLLNTVGSGSNSNYGSAGSTISTNGNATSINIGDQSDTEPTLVIGELYITNYQIRFQCIAKPSLILTTPTSSILTMAPKYPQSETNTYSNYYSQYISSNTNNGPTTDNKFNSLGYISIKSKDLQVLKFLFFKDSSYTIEKVMEALKAATSKRVFAFAFRKHIASYPIQIYSQEDIEKGWKVYKMKREFKRQGLFTRYQTNPAISWRISNINSKFKICDTYPEHFVVPKDVSDEMLAASAAFRSKGRIPVLSWIHPHKNICIVRSSQPMVGITRARCKEDEELVDAIRRASGSERLQIIDCRPKANAWANTVMGKGYENIAYYTNCSIEFMNIENIHAMTNSLNLLKKLIQNKQNNDQYWLSSFEATGWLKHTKLIMQAASKVVTYIERFDTSVLVHCSDGWDRTAQICALAELLLDPFYRTIKGFEILIEREWVSFGHKFLDRVGHGCVGKTNSASDEISPVFLQFIDCVWQVWQQYPSHFEFNEAFLFLILDSLYSCRFGNFLLNCVKQQFDENITKDTISVWTEVMTNPSLYHNDVYNPKNSEYSTLIVNTDIDTLSTHFWISYFYRYKKGSKNRYHRMLKKAISKMKKENAILLNSLQEELMTRKRIEHELALSKQKIKFLEGHNSLTDESHISDSYGSHAASDTTLSYNGEDGDTKVIRFSSSVKENLVENYFK